MKRSQRRRFVTALPLVCLAACGGGGSGSDGTVSGLAAPSSMEVITVDDAGSLPAPGTITPQAAVDDFPAGCDYFTDPARKHVWDPAIEPIAMINEILCYMGQTGADQMVNEGPYNAQIDEAKCQSGGDPSSSSQGQSSSSNGVQPSLWVVDSTRADNDSPQNVHVWVPDNDGGLSGTIYVAVQIDAEATQANPFGKFLLNFASVPDGGSIANPRMVGVLQSDDQGANSEGYTFFTAKGDINQVPPVGEAFEMVAVTVSMAGDQSVGQARLSKAYRFNDPINGDSGIIDEDFLLDIDADEVLRQLGADPAQCYSRTTFHLNTYRYNLYEATGANAGRRVELNSGFPIKTQDDFFGWLGYWGLWLPSEASIQNGDTITRQEFGSSATTDYTVVMAPGKLIQYTRNSLDLVDGEGQIFEWWYFPIGGQPGRFQVELTGGLFYEIATWDDPSQTWIDLGAPVLIDTADMSFLNMHSQSLGGPVGYIHGDSFLTYFAQEFVNGEHALFNGGTSVTLYGYSQCLKSGITGGEADAGDVFLADQIDINTPYLFEFDRASLTLLHDVNGDGSVLTQVGLASGQQPGGGPFMWGMRSGPMVTDTAGVVSPWDLWNQAVFFQYETGHNPWNQYTTAVDSNGDYVVFDAPIQFSYTHSTLSDANGDASFDGQVFQLGYGGPGNLWGIPSQGVDFDGDGNPERWFPSCSIADGTECGPTGTEYVIKGTESELTLLEVPGGCVGLDVLNAAGLTLPSSADVTVPNIGAKPVVDAPPAVIEGKKQ